MYEDLNPLQAIKDIRKLMVQSSRFRSLSGLGAVAAGFCAIGGWWYALQILPGDDLNLIKTEISPGLSERLLLTGVVTFLSALVLSLIFSFFRAKRTGEKFWQPVTLRLFRGMALPILAGGFFLYQLSSLGYVELVSPVSLLCYGFALLYAGRYTIDEVRYLGSLEILLAVINIFLPEQGLYFWVIGFGIFHIFYGGWIWWRYERSGSVNI